MRRLGDLITKQFKDAMTTSKISLPSQTARCHKGIQSLDVIQLADALLKMQTVIQTTGLSAATIYRKVAAGELKIVKMGARCTRFHAADVRAFIQAQAGCTKAPPRTSKA